MRQQGRITALDLRCPSQYFLPCAGRGESHCLIRIWNPHPDISEHSVQDFHCPHCISHSPIYLYLDRLNTDCLLVEHSSISCLFYQTIQILKSSPCPTPWQNIPVDNTNTVIVMLTIALFRHSSEIFRCRHYLYSAYGRGLLLKNVT